MSTKLRDIHADKEKGGENDFATFLQFNFIVPFSPINSYEEPSNYCSSLKIVILINEILCFFSYVKSCKNMIQNYYGEMLIKSSLRNKG